MPTLQDYIDVFVDLKPENEREVVYTTVRAFTYQIVQNQIQVLTRPENFPDYLLIEFLDFIVEFNHAFFIPRKVAGAGTFRLIYVYAFDDLTLTYEVVFDVNYDVKSHLLNTTKLSHEYELHQTPVMRIPRR
jgi:hypothetical protein